MQYRLLALAMAFSALGFTAQGAELEAIRATNHQEHTRIVLDMKDPATQWDVSSNHKKDQLTLVLPHTKNNMNAPIRYESARDGLLKGVRMATNGRGDLIVTLQAKEPVQHNLFVLENPPRMVVDIFTNFDEKKVKSINKHLTFFNWNRSISSGRLQVYVGVDTDAQSVMVYNDTSKMRVDEKTALALPVYGIISSVYNDYAPKAYLEGSEAGYRLHFKEPSYQVHVGGKTIPITAVNAKREENALVMYTPRYGYTTGTNAYGAEAVIVKNRVVAINPNDSAIPENAIVLSGHGKMEDFVKGLKLGMELRVQEGPAHIQRKNEVLISGIPVLSGGQYIGSDRMDGNENRTGRSFLGITSEGYIVAVLMVGGEGNSVGVTMREGVDILREMGVENAVALNTGDYANMYVEDHFISKKMPWKKYKQVIVLQ